MRTLKQKIVLWTLYVFFLVGMSYLVTEGFYTWRFWKWVLG